VEGARPSVKETIEFARIVAFTDGVFAIAITVLVLGIDVPAELPEQDLHSALVIGSAALLSRQLLRAALRRGHVDPAMRSAAEDMAAGALHPVIVFYASIPIALLSPVLGQLFWLTLLLDVFRRRR
jgi:hypothetical protein